MRNVRRDPYLCHFVDAAVCLRSSVLFCWVELSVRAGMLTGLWWIQYLAALGLLAWLVPEAREALLESSPSGGSAADLPREQGGEEQWPGERGRHGPDQRPARQATADADED